MSVYALKGSINRLEFCPLSFNSSRISGEQELKNTISNKQESWKRKRYLFFKSRHLNSEQGPSRKGKSPERTTWCRCWCWSPTSKMKSSRLFCWVPRGGEKKTRPSFLFFRERFLKAMQGWLYGVYLPWLCFLLCTEKLLLNWANTIGQKQIFNAHSCHAQGYTCTQIRAVSQQCGAPDPTPEVQCRMSAVGSRLYFTYPHRFRLLLRFRNSSTLPYSSSNV